MVGATVGVSACCASNAVEGICGFEISLAGAGALAAPLVVIADDANEGEACLAGSVAELAVADSLSAGGGVTVFSLAAAARWSEAAMLPDGLETGCHGYC